MTEKLKIVYESGCKNTEFLSDILEADGDKKPNFCSSYFEKMAFTAIYYGWLVGKYGSDWKKFL